MKEIWMNYKDFKNELLDKGALINYKILRGPFDEFLGYEVFVLDRDVFWMTTAISEEDIQDFEANYKDKANKNFASK